MIRDPLAVALNCVGGVLVSERCCYVARYPEWLFRIIGNDADFLALEVERGDTHCGILSYVFWLTFVVCFAPRSSEGLFLCGEWFAVPGNEITVPLQGGDM